MATNEQVLLAILARRSHEKDARLEERLHVVHYVQLVKKERSAAKLGCGPRTGPLVEKTLLLLEEEGLGALSEDDDDDSGMFDFHLMPVGVARIREAYEAYLALPESSTSKSRRYAAFSTSRARELAKLGSFIKTRLFVAATIDEGPISSGSGSAHSARPLMTVLTSTGLAELSSINSSNSSPTSTSRSSFEIPPLSALPPPTTDSLPHTRSITSEGSGDAASLTSDFSDSPCPPKYRLPAASACGSFMDGSLLPTMGRRRSKAFVVEPRPWMSYEGNTKIDIVPGQIVSGVTTFGRPSTSTSDADGGDHPERRPTNGALDLDLGYFGPILPIPGIEEPDTGSRRSSISSGSVTYDDDNDAMDGNSVLEELRQLNTKIEQMERMLELGQLAGSHRTQSMPVMSPRAGSFSGNSLLFDGKSEEQDQGGSEPTFFLRPNSLSLSDHGSTTALAEPQPSDNNEDTAGSDPELSFDDDQLMELRALRSDLRTALWTADSCHASGVGPIRVFRDPPPSLATLSSQASSSPSGKAKARPQPYSKSSSPMRRRLSSGSLSDISVWGSDAGVKSPPYTQKVALGTTFLKKLRDRCVAYFRRISGRQARDTTPSES